MLKTIAIMQPTYLPWVGYFSLIDRVDEFVFLDNVQFERRSWQQRNCIKCAQGSVTLTVPVQKMSRNQSLICDVQIDHTSKFVHKHCTSLHHAYNKAPFFEKYKEIIFSSLREKTVLLADLNIKIIKKISDILGIETPMIRASELHATGNKDELLYNICCERCAHLYISPLGSKVYLDKSKFFGEETFPLIYHKYTPKPYHQLFGDFIPYMTILDLLFNEDSRALEIIRSGLGEG